MDITTTLESRILIQLEAAVAAHEGRRALNAGQSRSLGVIATKTT